MTVNDIPDPFILSTTHVHTDLGVYAIVQAIDGDWLRCVSGDDWIGTTYGHAYVKLRSDGQRTALQRLYQEFVTWDDRHHDAGGFRDITYPES